MIRQIEPFQRQPSLNDVFDSPNYTKLFNTDFRFPDVLKEPFNFNKMKLMTSGYSVDRAHTPSDFSTPVYRHIFDLVTMESFLKYLLKKHL